MRFANISDDVRANCDKEFCAIADAFAQTVAEATFDTLLKKMDETEKPVFLPIRNEQIQKIKPYLANGIINGGSRTNDRPWGFDKVVEESRQQLLSALIKASVPYFGRGTNISAEDFKGKYVEPKLKIFSLPNKCIDSISPMLRKLNNK